MANLIAGFASSHAYIFMDPDQWDERRESTRASYARRYGVTPPERPEIAAEALADNRARFARIRQGLERIRAEFERMEPDALVLVGDDQNENYREDNLPQFAVYVGDEVATGTRGGGSGVRYRCDSALARAILEELVEEGFDLASSRSFPNDALISHAHQQVLSFLDPAARVPIVPVFVNAIHVPAPSPKRCYEFGQALRAAIESQPGGKRVALYASGGWSHFTAGYPYEHYAGPHTLGSIAVDFDRQLEELLAEGRGSEVANLTSRDLIDNGDIEFRQWIVLLGAVGDAKPDLLVYEPFFRGVMGMATGFWSREGQRVGAGGAPLAAG